MVKIIPFRGVRYNKEIVQDLNLLVTEPYDKIDSKLQEEYYNKSEYNFVRLDKNRDEDPYTSAKAFFTEWMQKKVLIQDENPCIYYYTQEYEFEGIRKIRKGFIALLEVDEFENGNVLPHEKTLSGPKKDRFDLLIATEATFGQIFMLYSDPENKIKKSIADIEKQSPDIKVNDKDANIHCVWKISDADVISQVQAEMKTKKVYIADGHHRYETSLNYRNLQKEMLGNVRGDELFHYTMCTFINMDDKEGMSILPTHRFIRNLSDFDISGFLSQLEAHFSIRNCSNLQELYQEMHQLTAQHAFGLVASGGKHFYLLVLKDEKSIDQLLPESYSNNLKYLDVMILHKLILENFLGIDEEKLRQQSHVDYYRDKDEAVSLLNHGKYQIGFLLNSTKIEEVKNVTENGEKMPQKSTDFYPKLLSGLVINYLK